MAAYHVLKFLILTFFLSIYSIEISADPEDNVQPEVTISQGTLRGTTLTSRKNRNISAFMGIPYAQPPIGALRFASPVAANGWDGKLNATADSNRCSQLLFGTSMGDEDCLYLNVYIPQTTESSLLPVMVYIHGGGYNIGSNVVTSYGPQYILDEDVILVVPNYRLGPFGFLSTGDEEASGNWGLKDLVLALQWVQENIEYFGGDPDRVTLYGESSGATSVHLLMLSDTTVGLFHRSIMQSGSALATWAYRPRSAYSQIAFDLGTYVGCSNATSDSLISCLRTINASDILATDPLFAGALRSMSFIWGPTDEPDIEGAILTDTPPNLLAAGSIRDIPCIFGVNRDEGLENTAVYYEDEESLRTFLDNFDEYLPELTDWKYLPDSGAAWVKAVKSYYFNDDLTISSELLTNLTALFGDAQYKYPAHYALGVQYAAAKNPQYFYAFNYRGKYSFSRFYGGSVEGRGIAHGDDLIYFYPNTNIAVDGNLTLSETDNEIVDTMVQLWASFATNGKPTASCGSGTITWEPYSDKDNFLRIGNESDTASEMQNSFLPERMQFWADIDTL